MGGLFYISVWTKNNLYKATRAFHDRSESFPQVPSYLQSECANSFFLSVLTCTYGNIITGRNSHSIARGKD